MSERKGTSAVEYGIIAALIAIAAISAMAGLGRQLKGTFNPATDDPRAVAERAERAFIAACHKRGGYVTAESHDRYTPVCIKGDVLGRFER